MFGLVPRLSPRISFLYLTGNSPTHFSSGQVHRDRSHRFDEKRFSDAHRPHDEEGGFRGIQRRTFWRSWWLERDSNDDRPPILRIPKSWSPIDFQIPFRSLQCIQCGVLRWKPAKESNDEFCFFAVNEVIAEVIAQSSGYASITNNGAYQRYDDGLFQWR